MLSRVACLLCFALLATSCGRSRSQDHQRPLNLLLVTIDTVRADHIGVYGDAAAETPSLDRLAREGVRFARASSPVPLTLPAHASILSGLLPPHHGVHNNGAERFPDAPATLATDLAAAGYRTGAFIGAFVLDHRFGLARGFQTYDDDIDINSQRAAGLDAERPGRVVTDRAVDWLEHGDGRPFFAWVHLYDAHAPYEPPEPYRTRFRDAPYDGEIAEVDHEVGRLLAELDRLGVAAKTVVAVTGDHGEALGEHGELTHGLLLYEPTLHVPVIVRDPGVLPAGWAVATPVSLVDLAPTLVGLLGRSLETAGAKLDGRDLTTDLRSRREPPASDVFAESRYAAVFGWSPLAALRRGDMKYIAAPRPELYDLGHDPGERDNLLTSGAAKAGELASRIGTFASAGASSTPAQLDSEARAKLSSLGYISGATAEGDAASGRPPKDPKDMIGLFQAFDRAHWAFVAGELTVARKELEGLVAADPGNPVFVGQLAEVCRAAGDRERAITLYKRAVALSPSDRDARYNLAVTLQEAGHQDAAITALETAIWLDPGRPEAHNTLGIALAAKGELAAARDQFARAAELEPRNARVENNLANVLRDLKRFDEAEVAYRKATELAPDYADPWNGLGTIEVQRQRPAAALPYFEKALALAPALHEVRLNRAIAEDLAGDRPAAISSYHDFLDHAAGDPQFAAQRQVARRLLARLKAGSPRS